MRVTSTVDSRLVSAVREEISSDSHSGYLSHVLGSVLGGIDCYLWGGAVRDPILKMMYGTNGHINDFDILVDDSQTEVDLNNRFINESNIFYNRFGTLKLKPGEGIELDVARFSDIHRVKESRENITIEKILESCDLSTGAIAYDVRKGIIYEFSALDSLKNRVIEVLDHAHDEPHVLMTKLVLHSNKFGFSIGDTGIKLVTTKYSPEMDENIHNYLAYKGLQKKQDYVITTLNEIASTHK
jgi:tRNA nucleotidyltransferase/poly(A) polymerase